MATPALCSFLPLVRFGPLFVLVPLFSLLGFGIKKAVQLWGLHRLRLFQGDKDTRTTLATGQNFPEADRETKVALR